MPYDPYEAQKRQKDEHRNTILILLKERRMSFTELQKATRFSPMGLTKMLNDLKNADKIEKENPKKRKSPYKIKGSGLRIKEVFFPGPQIYDIRNRGGKYYVDLPNHMQSELFNFVPAFGITSHFLLDRTIGKKYFPLWKKDFFEIEKFVYDKIFKKHLHGGLPINESIKAKIFVILEIEYEILTKIIKSRSEKENEKLAMDKLKELKLNP